MRTIVASETAEASRAAAGNPCGRRGGSTSTWRNPRSHHSPQRQSTIAERPQAADVQPTTPTCEKAGHRADSSRAEQAEGRLAELEQRGSVRTGKPPPPSTVFPLPPRGDAEGANRTRGAPV